MFFKEFSHFFKESYSDDREDNTTGTSEFDESMIDDPDDCYCESEIFESGQFDKYGKDVDLSEARGPIESETDVFYKELKKELGQDDTVQEAALTSKKRNSLKDSDFALVYTDEKGKKIRKYPVNDEAHVKSAAHFFPKGVPEKYRGQVARRILREARKYKLDTSGWKNVNKAKDKN